MAGATNRAMKSAGVPKASIKTIRVKAGGRLTLQSAISIAREHGLDVGKAPEHLARREAKVETKRQAAQATAKAAQQGKVARSLGDAGKGMLAARKAAAPAAMAKEGRAAMLVARLRDRAGNMGDTPRGDRASDRAARILNAYPGAKNLAAQLQGERRLEAKQTVARVMRTSMQDTSRRGSGLPETRSGRVAGLLGAMKAREAQAAVGRVQARAAVAEAGRAAMRAKTATPPGGMAKQGQVRRGQRFGNLVVLAATPKQVTTYFKSELSDGGGSRGSGKNYVYRWDGKGYKNGGDYLKV